MSALAASLVICAILIAGALLGTLLRHWLPESHLDVNAKDVVRLGCGLLGTITGLVLGLLVNSAKTSYEIQRDEIRLMTANAITIDRLLEQYGPDARKTRVDLRVAIDAAIERLWNDGQTPSGPRRPFALSNAGETVFQDINALSPATDPQRLYKTQLLQTFNSILQTRVVLFEQSGAGMPLPFLIVLVFWLTILFMSFSLFSPLSPTAFGALVLFAISASGAIFLILEMYQPFSGLMQIDSEPLRRALVPLG
jgi:hypothetical protein